MGLKAIGHIESYEQVKLKLPLKDTIVPDVRNASAYHELHRLFEQAYQNN